MIDFDLPGWHEVTYEQWRGDTTPAHGDTAYLRVGTEDHYFWREDPVPPLPTVPYTVIRVTWKPQHDTNHRVLTFIEGNEYEWVGSNDQYYASNLPDMIASFEVLSEPRAVTAPLVLGRLLRRLGEGRIRAEGLHEAIDEVGNEFGVES